jgi:ACDE family multidrug resistance protein
VKVSNRLTLLAILASATLTVGAGSVIAPVLNVIREELSINPTSVGIIVTTHALFIAISSPLIGNLVDRIGIKKPFIAGLCLYGLAGGSGLFITSYWKLIISRAILGVAAAAILVPVTVLILNLYTGSERNTIMGWRGSANSLGSIIWPLIGGFLGTFSWQLPFAVYLIGIPLGILVAFTIPETGKVKPQKEEKQSSLIEILKGKPILFLIYGLTFLSMALLYVILIFLPQRLAEIGISNPFYISVFFSVMGVSMGIASFMYGKIKQSFSYKKIVLVAAKELAKDRYDAIKLILAGMMGYIGKEEK